MRSITKHSPGGALAEAALGRTTSHSQTNVDHVDRWLFRLNEAGWIAHLDGAEARVLLVLVARVNRRAGLRTTVAAPKIAREAGLAGERVAQRALSSLAHRGIIHRETTTAAAATALGLLAAPRSGKPVAISTLVQELPPAPTRTPKRRRRRGATPDTGAGARTPRHSPTPDTGAGARTPGASVIPDKGMPKPPGASVGHTPECLTPIHGGATTNRGGVGGSGCGPSSSPPPAGEEDGLGSAGEILAALVSAGLAEDDARRQLARCGLDAARDALLCLRRRKRPPHNPAGFVSRAMRERWTPPPRQPTPEEVALEAIRLAHEDEARARGGVA